MRPSLYFGSLLAGVAAACGSSTTQQSSAPAAPPTVAAPPPVAAPAAPADTAPATSSKPAARPLPGTYPYTLPPVDQTAQYPALQAFERRVLAACAARRQADLLKLVSDSVVVSYGGGLLGRADFVRYFLSGDWGGYEKLREAIRLGGTVRRNSAGYLLATYPYVQDSDLYQQSHWLATLDLDPYTSYVGLTPQVDVYQQPNSASRRLARLRYPVLLSSYDARPKGNWRYVVAADSSFQGYARASQLYLRGNMTLLVEAHGAGFWITSVAPFD